MGKSSIIMRQQKNNTRDVPRQPITGFQVSTLWTRGVKDESQGSSKGSDSLQGPQQAGGSSGKHSTRYFSCPQHHKTSFILWPRTGLAQDLAPWSHRDLKACCLFPQLSVHGSGVTSGIKCLGNTWKRSWDPSPGNGRGEQGVSYEEVVRAGSHQICGYGQESEDLGVSGHPGGP